MKMKMPQRSKNMRNEDVLSSFHQKRVTYKTKGRAAASEIMVLREK